jgi:hypothetical protein
MYQLSSVRVTSTAPPSAFFERWADMDSWPEWDQAIRWVRRDGPFAEGTRGSLRPKGGPKVDFVIETLVPDREFTDRSTMPGASLTIRHLVEVLDDGRTGVAVVVSIDGPLARLWKLFVGRGIAESTPAGLRRLVELVEADESGEAATDTGGEVAAADTGDEEAAGGVHDQ